MRSISCSTQFCAVIGNPVEHSLSPAIHNAAFEALDLDFVYVACPVEDVKGALAGMRALGNFRGMSVTIPHKIEVMKHVDEVAEVDRSIGSINTVLHEGDKLIGLGTDGPAALKAITDSGVEPTGKNVLMMGAGGAARAISFTIARNAERVELCLLDIDEVVLGKLAADLETGTDAAVKASISSDRSLAEAMEAAEIVIHCTPIGMHPNADASAIPPELFRSDQVVFDVVYTPLETKLLADAKSRGCATISGVEMFVNQAVLQFERFEAPVEVMRRVVMDQLTA
jgi:shikimate dehydrogenase